VYTKANNFGLAATQQPVTNTKGMRWVVSSTASTRGIFFFYLLLVHKNTMDATAAEKGEVPEIVSLTNMVIGSVDTLRGTALSKEIPPTWNDQPPLLQGRRNVPETPLLLKGVST
jgi:hypothetical protein